jgi:hypothetical protein
MRVVVVIVVPSVAVWRGGTGNREHDRQNRGIGYVAETLIREI